MDYTGKPVHIITNDRRFIQVLEHYGLAIETWTDDWTAEGTYHCHILCIWRSKEGKLSPARRTAIKRARNFENCEYCTGKTFVSRCLICEKYYKLIWCHTQEHENNVRFYINKKRQEDLRGPEQQ